MSPIRRLLPRRVRAFYVGHRSAIGFLLLFAACLGSVYVAVKAGERADERINGNRVEQTRQSCHERNVERRTLRRKVAAPLVATFRAQREQTQRVPVAAFRQFELTKAEAIDRLNMAVSGLEQAKAAFHQLDCRARVQAVRDALD